MSRRGAFLIELRLNFNRIKTIYMNKSLVISPAIMGLLLGTIIYGLLAPGTIHASSQDDSRFCKVVKSGYEVKRTIRRVVTAYSSAWDETTGIPGKPGLITASGKPVADGVVAYNYLPFGTKIMINAPGFEGQIFTVADRTAEGRKNIDVWKRSKEEALDWGAQVLTIDVLEES